MSSAFSSSDAGSAEASNSGTAPESSTSPTTMRLAIMPIQHIYGYTPGVSGVNRMTFSPGTSLCSMPYSGMKKRLLQPLMAASSAVMRQTSGTPARRRIGW